MDKQDRKPLPKKYNRIYEVMHQTDTIVAELALAIKHDVNTISRWRRNASQPMLSELYQIADLLGVDIRSLLMPNARMRPTQFWKITTEKPPNPIYNRLATVMAENQHTEETLAKSLDRQKRTVQRWMDNSQQPPIKTLYLIADALEVDIRTLVFPNKNATPPYTWLLLPTP